MMEKEIEEMRKLTEKYEQKLKMITKNQTEVKEKRELIEENIRQLRNNVSMPTNSASVLPNPQTVTRECILCMDEAATNACIPCGHVVKGQACNDKLNIGDRCPVCRKVIQNWLRIFL